VRCSSRTSLSPPISRARRESAVQHALALAAREQAQILLLHVLPGLAVPGTEDQRQATAEQWLHDLARHAALPVDTLVVWGDHPAVEICRVAQERQCDLIAMSTHGRTGRALDFIGSVADAVVRRAPCAVLLLRASLFQAA
jgi:nucleotide-binding universal stress UspA family protein